MLYLFGGALLPHPHFGFDRLVMANHKVELPCHGGKVVLGPFERYVFAWTFWQLAVHKVVDLAIDPNAKPPSRRHRLLPLFLNLTARRTHADVDVVGVLDEQLADACTDEPEAVARVILEWGRRKGVRPKELVFLPLEAIVDLVHRDTCIHLGLEPSAPGHTRIDCSVVEPLRERFQGLRADWELFTATEPELATALLDGSGSGVGYLRPVPNTNFHL